MPTTIDPFSNFLPVRIRFGDGVVDELAGILDDAGVRRPFVLLDPVLDGLPALMPALEAVRAQSDEVIGHPLEPGEPTFESIDAAAEALASSNADAVIAIGGGSALDTAKGARLIASQGGPFARFVGGDVPIEPPRLPLVTIPTTSRHRLRGDRRHRRHRPLAQRQVRRGRAEQPRAARARRPRPDA